MSHPAFHHNHSLTDLPPDVAVAVTNATRGPSSALMWVDGNYTGSVENGAAGTPYKTVQAGLDALKAQSLHGVLLIHNSTYVEVVAMPDDLNVTLVALGDKVSVSQLVLDVKLVAAGTRTVRIVGLGGVFEIPVGIVLTDTGVQAITLDLDNAKTKIDGSTFNLGTVNLVANDTTFNGTVVCPTLTLAKLTHCKITNTVTAYSYGEVTSCNLAGNLTFSRAGGALDPATLEIPGFIGCNFAAPGYTFTGTAIGDLHLDGVSNFYYKGHAWVTAGPSTKNILSDLVA